MSKSKQSIPKACPCDSGKAYKQCCHPLHEGSPAANAEQLMRSRYTAYVLMLEEYLLQTFWRKKWKKRYCRVCRPLQSRWE